MRGTGILLPEIQVFLPVIIGLVLFCCKPTSQISQPKGDDAKVLYQRGVASYDDGDLSQAQTYFEAALRADSTLIDARKGLAAVAHDRGDFQTAILQLEVVAMQDNPDPVVWYRLGLAHWREGNYLEATSAFDQFLERPTRNSEMVSQAQKYARDAAFIADQSIVESLATPLSELVNTSAPEYLPSLTADGKTMVFTRRISGQEDFFRSEFEDGAWTQPQPISELNTRGNEGAHFLSSDGNMLLFTRCNDPSGMGSCDLYFSGYDGKQWQQSRNMGPGVNTPHWDAQPCLSADGRRLFFASNRPGGKGGRDIWYLERTADGWSNAVNLVEVNTSSNDESPFLHPDGVSLYFMSEGHPGFGGYDLFYVNLNNDRPPENLGASVNSAGDEGAMHIAVDGRAGYFARSKVAGGRDIDIYYCPLPDRVVAEQSTFVLIEAYDQSNGERIKADATLQSLSEPEVVSNYQVGIEKRNLMTVIGGETYALRLQAPGYAFYSEHVDLTKPSTKLDPIRLRVELQPLSAAPKTEEPIILRNVFFATGSAELLPESYSELNVLRKLLADHSNLHILIAGHTDDVGSPTDNLRLSDARAKTVYDYLVDRGIDTDRLTYQGYGEARPIASNENAEGRRQNRRTEFVITQR